MGMREGLFLTVLILSLHVASASTMGEMQIDRAVMKQFEKTVKRSEVVENHNKLCTTCENVAAVALDFFKDKKNGDAVRGFLHEVCSRTYSLEKECIESVDQYTTFFFDEIAKMSPEDLCKDVYLCGTRASAGVLQSESTCIFCHHLVDEVLTKLKDPDAEFEVVQLLLKQCGRFEGYVQKCKRMVLEYAPLIMINGEKFLEKNDVCAALAVCPAQHKASLRPFAADSLLEAA